MTRTLIRSLIIAVSLVCVFSTRSEVNGQSRQPKPLVLTGVSTHGDIFIVPVEGMIDKPLANYLDRAIRDAEQANAAIIVLNVDTFGGLVDAADQMRQSLLNTRIPVVAFIDKNAASAGALISYAADRIVMVPGSSIGAATVVEGGSGEAAPDKYQSYMRGLMRSTAEANGRDPRIAEAMVDESIEVPGVKEKGKVLTLSAREAFKLGVSDGTLVSIEDLKKAMTLTDRVTVMHEVTWAEQLLRFFGSPVVQSILMLMMLGGLYFELHSPGFGFAGLMALIGAVIFFAPNYLLGLVESWEIVLFVIGAVLLALEVFVLPGFGVAGITGLVLIVGSLIASLIGNVGFQFPSMHEMTSAVWTMVITLLLLVAFAYSLARYIPRTRRFNQLVLEPDLAASEGFTAGVTDDSLVGKNGLTVTPLRPSGAVEIEGRRIDVVTQGEFIPPGQRVEVTSVRGARVEVRPFKSIPDLSETSPA